MRVVVMPANFVSTGWGTPTVCARHGETGTEHRRIVFRSLVPGWVYLFLLFSPLVAIIVGLVVRRKTVADAWPFCPRCHATHRRRRGATLGVLAVAVVFAVLGFTLPDTSDGAFGFGLTVVILLIVAAIAATRSTAGWVAAGYTTADSSAVEFRSPAPLFVEQVAAAKKAAAEYHAPIPAP